MQKNSSRKDPKTAAQVKRILELISKTAPGKAVELRIPRYGAIQCVAGVNHRRGIPANQVEMSAHVLIQLAQDPTLWSSLAQSGQIHTSGQLSNLSEVFSKSFNNPPIQGGI
jgi:hypothetical protein